MLNIALQLTREYNIQCCCLYYPVLKQHIQYEYEACDSDPVERYRYRLYRVICLYLLLFTMMCVRFVLSSFCLHSSKLSCINLFLDSLSYHTELIFIYFGRNSRDFDLISREARNAIRGKRFWKLTLVISVKLRITADHAAATTLGKEARRWSTRIAREVNSVRENNRKIQALLQLKEAGQKVRNLRYTEQIIYI